MNDFDNFFFGKKVMITGSSGFIGSHLSKKLLHKGAEVHPLVRKESNLWRLESILDKIEIIEIDLLNLKSVQKLIGTIKPNYIFHFAIPPHSLLQNKNDLDRQIDITNHHLINLFASIKSQNIKLDAFIHACSGAVYQWKPDCFVLNELTPLLPETLRGKLKLSQRNLCLELGKTHDIPVKLARIFRAYGPWEVKSKLIIKALDAERTKTPIPIGSNLFKRDYIFINDLIDGILRLTKSILPSGTEMNFGSSLQYNASEIIFEMEQILGSQIPKHIGAYPKNLYDRGNFIADCSLAKQKLDWQPKTSINQGLKETITWYKNQHK